MIQTRPLRLEVKLLKTRPVGILDILQLFCRWFWQNCDVEIQLWWTLFTGFFETEMEQNCLPLRKSTDTSALLQKYIFLWKWSHWNIFFLLVMWEKMLNVNLEKFDKAMYHLQDLLIQAHENYTYRYIVCVNKKELYRFIKSFLE